MAFPTLLLLLAVAGADTDAALYELRLNQMQVIGTHNSYHLRPNAKALSAIVRVQPAAKDWDYSREPLDVQLDRGIRSFELDLHLYEDEWQVMHVPLLDAGTTVPTFARALETVRSWSDRHPRHVPISFLIELKKEGIRLVREIRQPEAADLDALDELIRAAFPAERLITPDDVRGEQSTLPAAIAADGWPTLREAAGKVLFVLHDRGMNRDNYLADRPALEGRAMFVNSTPGEPHAATIVLDNPRDPRIDELARQGYFIRTRADSIQNRSAQRRERAMHGAAHILTTDHPLGEVDAGRAFHLPDGAAARANPITAAPHLTNQPIPEPIP